NDWSDLAERIRRGTFRDPPASSRISGLDFRAQRCVERHFLHAHAWRLLPLCEVSLPRPLCDDVDHVLARSAVQVDASDGPFHPIVARLLAAPAFCRTIINQAT